MVWNSNGGLKTGQKKDCLWFKMSSIQMVRQVTWLYHLNTRHPYCLVFRCSLFRWLLYLVTYFSCFGRSQSWISHLDVNDGEICDKGHSWGILEWKNKNIQLWSEHWPTLLIKWKKISGSGEEWRSFECCLNTRLKRVWFFERHQELEWSKNWNGPMYHLKFDFSSLVFGPQLFRAGMLSFCKKIAGTLAQTLWTNVKRRKKYQLKTPLAKFNLERGLSPYEWSG